MAKGLRGRLAATLVLVTAAAACGSNGDDPATAGQPQGFDRVAVEVTTAEGELCELCLWLAESPAQRGRGLTEVTDLGPADGMLFRWDEPATSGFHMREVPIPLSIAWYGPDGSFVSTVEMAPCTQEPLSDCPVYVAADSYTEAIEVPAGALAELGIGPGSRLVVRDEPCPQG